MFRTGLVLDVLTNPKKSHGHHTRCRGARPVPPWACLPGRRLGPLHRVFPLKREKVAPAWQARPWEHRPSSSAPCAVPMGPSTIGQHIKDEPCAKQRALLVVFSSRFSSVSRDIPTRFRPVAVSVFHMLVQVYKFVRTVGLPHHFGMLMRCPGRGAR